MVYNTCAECIRCLCHCPTVGLILGGSQKSKRERAMMTAGTDSADELESINVWWGSRLKMDVVETSVYLKASWFHNCS
jgi:hypothetical protein